MRLKILIVSTIMLVLFFANCKTNLKTGEGKMEKNKEIALGVSKSIMSGDWDKVNQLLDDNFVYIATSPYKK